MTLHEYPLVSIVTVNYNQAEVTRDLMRSLKNLSYPKIEVIVVDNGSKVDPSAIVKEAYPDAQVISSKDNLGFAGGNNLGVRRANGKYILFLNNDTEVEPGFLEPLVELFENNPNAGMATPKLVYHNSGNLIQYAGCKQINPFTGRGRKIGYMQTDMGQFNKSHETALGHGAALMVPMSVIREVGMMSEIFFLYYEEHDWCEMVKRAGYKIYYVAESTVYHKESTSVGKYNAFKTYFLSRNRLLYLRRNTFGITRVISILFFLLIAVPKNILLHLIKGEFDHIASICRGLFWNLSHFEIEENPQLKFKTIPVRS